MKFESDEEGKKHFIHQAFIDDGYDSLFWFSELSEEESNKVLAHCDFSASIYSLYKIKKEIDILKRFIRIIHEQYGDSDNVWRDYKIYEETFKYFYMECIYILHKSVNYI